MAGAGELLWPRANRRTGASNILAGVSKPEGRRGMRQRTQIQVRYVETDRMKVAHHSSFLAWFEVGRTELLASAGFPYAEMEKRGYFLPVVSFCCRLKGSADYGDRVVVETWVERLGSRMIVFAYRVLKRGEEIAQGRTTHFSVDSGNGYRRLPAELLSALEPYRL